MPKSHRKRRIRRPFRFHQFNRPGKPLRFYLFTRYPYFALTYIALGCVICLSMLLSWSGTLSWPGTSQSTGKRETSPGQASVLSLHYRVTGAPSIDADFINKVLQHYHSPASGDGEAFYAQGVKYGIDPVFALAFFMEESTFGTKGVARTTHSLGNIRATPGYSSYHGYRYYKTWTEGSADWYRLIAQLYVKRWGLITVDQIIPVYAPSRDHNSPTHYIHKVKWAVDRWRRGIVTI
jgi:hypothetical protein